MKVIGPTAVQPTGRQLFNADGTVRGVNYGVASGKRGAMLSVTLRRGAKDGKKLTTGFIVDGVDFGKVYAQVVTMVADFYDLPGDDPMRADMVSSKAAFLAAKGLVIKPVVIRYDQVSLADEG
jgi:hypothetical protein